MILENGVVRTMDTALPRAAALAIARAHVAAASSSCAPGNRPS